MQVSIAFVTLEVRGEFGMTGNVAYLRPDAIADPPSDVPEFTGGKPKRIKVVRHLCLIPNGRSVGASDDPIRQT